MATKTVNTVKGLSSFNNYLASNDGSELSSAENVVVDRDDIIEPRRGIKVFNELPDKAKQLLSYRDQVLTHYDNTLNYMDSKGNPTIFKNIKDFEIAAPTTNITVKKHGLSVGEIVTFSRRIDYSAPPVTYFTLPSGISEYVNYYVKTIVSEDVFEISATSGGSAISLGIGEASVIFNYKINEVLAGRRIKGFELNNNFYITTANGIKKITNLNAYSISDAGVPEALNPNLALNFSGTGGFFSADPPATTYPVEVAYRVVWGIKDANDNLILGKASQATILQNGTGVSTSVDVSFLVPDGITVNHFYQIYRTAVAISGGSGDEMKLVIQANYDGYSSVVTVNDNTPETIRRSGVPLYSNEFSGEGAFQVNDAPPVCEDVTIYKNRAWYANTKTKQQLELTFLGFDGVEDAILPADVASVTGANPCTISFNLPHNISNNAYIALANTLGIDGQYQVTVLNTTDIQINANSANFGSDYAIYRSNIVIEKGSQSNRYFPVGRPEITTIETLGYAVKEKTEIRVNNTGTFFDVAGVGAYLYLHTPTASFYFWFSVTDGANYPQLDPAIIGLTGYEVELLSTDTQDQIASKLQSAIASFTTDFTATVVNDTITVTNVAGGVATDSTDVGTGFTINVLEQGTVGCISGDYFTLTSIDDKIKYYFWVANSSSDVDPLVPGRVGFKIDLYTNPVVTAADVALKIKDAVQQTGDFFVSNITTGTNPDDTLEISTITSGAVTDVASATTNPGCLSFSNVSVIQEGFGENANLGFYRYSAYASPALAIEDTTKSLVNVINYTSSSPVYAYYIVSDSSLPGQMFLQEKTFSEENFTVIANNSSFGAMFNPDLTKAAKSTNNVNGNMLMFSKDLQPEAVPTVNSFSIGSKYKKIQRIIALRDSLFIFKEEGIYRLTGDSPANFSITLFDNSSILVAPDSAAVLNNMIYCLTTQGVATISETGVGIISRDIEDKFMLVTSEQYENTETIAFGIGYESDRAYLLFIPEEPNDEYAIRAYRFNVFTQVWTTVEKTATCGVINKNKMYLGSGDIDAVEVERKRNDHTDYVDRQYNRSFSAYSNSRLYLDDVDLIEVGDALSQIQYVSVDAFNSLVERLKLDPQLGFDQNFELMSRQPGSEFTDSVSRLVTELNLKDVTRYVGNFDLASDLNTTTDEIAIVGHEFLDDEVVQYSTLGTSPIGLTNGDYYLITDVTNNTFKLRPISASALVQGSANGIGTFSLGDYDITFNMISDIDFTTSEIVFPDHQLVEGDAIVFTTAGTPPTGLVNGLTYIVTETTDNRFKLKPEHIDFQNNAQTGSASLTKVYYYSGTNNNQMLQYEINRIIEALNNSNSVFYSDFDLLSGSEQLDVLVTNVETSQNYVEIEYPVAFYIGDMIHFKSIQSEVTWEYNALGDPAMMKHVRTGTIMFENNSLNKLQLGYATDLSGDFEYTEFTMDGRGQFGNGPFGNTAFGGSGTAYPIRTVIPRQKQRCRYISTSVTHRDAFFKFSIMGMSLDYEVTSERGYRR